MNHFTREQEQIAYKRLPSELQDHVMSNETSNLIADALHDAELSEEQTGLIDTQVLYALLCLQTIETTVANVATITAQQTAHFVTLKTVIEENVLNKFKELGINQQEMVTATEAAIKNAPVATPLPTTIANSTSTGIATSPSILPSTEPKKTSLEVSPSSLPTTKTAPTDMAPVQTPPVPAVLQAQKSIVEEKLTQVTVASAPAAKQPAPSYTTGKDPYREPVE